jgi:hypothetical protein
MTTSAVDKLAQALATERAVAPPTGTTEAGLARLLGSISAGVAPMPVAVGALSGTSFALAKWVAIGFVVGVTGAGVAMNASAPPVPVAAPLVAYSAKPLQRSSMVPPELPAELPADMGAAAPPASSGPRSVAPTPSVLEEPPRAAAPTFDEELRLITAAKRELDAGRPHLARAWLDEHRQRYASGTFSLEREGLRVLASCQETPNAELARRFVARYPASPMTAQILRRCGVETPPPARDDFSELGK